MDQTVPAYAAEVADYGRSRDPEPGEGALVKNVRPESDVYKRQAEDLDEERELIDTDVEDADDAELLPTGDTSEDLHDED